jgi:hypothetical protein
MKDNNTNKNKYDENEDHNNQIKDLKALLFQRDTEISILVSMVKKGKTADDVRVLSATNTRQETANNRKNDMIYNRIKNGEREEKEIDSESYHGDKNIERESDGDRERDRDKKMERGGSRRGEESAQKLQQTLPRQPVSTSPPPHF